MQALYEFPLEKYISFVENQFTIHKELNKYAEEIKRHIANSNHATCELNYHMCLGIQKMFEQKMTVFLNEERITHFGINLIAIGIFRIWFRDSNWSEDVEWITLKVY